MTTLIIPRGAPGSGKSTRLKMAAMVASYPIVRVCRDDLRDMLFNSRSLTRDQENAVTVSEKAQVEAFLKAGVSVIVDAMHLRASYVKEWAKIAKKHKASLEIWDEFLDVPLETCIANDKEREGTSAYVGEDVIRGIHRRFFPVPAVDLTDVKPVGEPYVPNLALPKTILVDIDGTVTTGPCDRSPYEWMKVRQDKPNESVIEVVRALYREGYFIIFLSGRDSVCRRITKEWLREHVGDMPGSVLLMRKEGDDRKDSVVKLELFDKHIRHYCNVVAVIDDRNQVVEMYRSLGLTVMQVAEGAF